MTETIILKQNPRIEFQLLEKGFNLIDGQSNENSGFYSYHDVQSIDLHKAWFPKLARGLRITTGLLNGVPYFPDAATCKKANLIIHANKAKVGIWLTDTSMAAKAKRIKALLDERTE